MITFLIYTLYKKYGKESWARHSIPVTKYLRVFFVVIFISLVVLLLTIIPIKSKAQKLQLNYTIVKGGDDIGWLKIERKVEGSKSIMLLNSEIKLRVIFLMTLSAKESAIFENGKLIYSSQFRKINGTTKLDKKTRLVFNKYEVLEDGQLQDMIFPVITANLLSLYFLEPIGIYQVYCDNHQCFTPIKKTDDGGYKVNFPDGNSNCYYYSGGICTKIKISHTFYTATITLNQ